MDDTLRSRDGARGALIYPVAGSAGKLWRIRAEKYPDHGTEGSHRWFGGRVLWGHDKGTREAAMAVARAWVQDAVLPEGESAVGQAQGMYGSGVHPAGNQYGPADMTMYDRS